jgi:predicted pyridoxine 5'-phosphate oxidase superfamily flavin-nucleotide-binding protein
MMDGYSNTKTEDPTIKPDKQRANENNMILDEETRDLIQRSVLCWLATVGRDGDPSVSPKELWGISGEDALVIAEIASPNSVNNIRHHSRVCVSFLDVFLQKGMKLYGNAELIPKDASTFNELGSELLEIAGEKFDVRNLIHVSVDRASKIVAPSYKLFPDTDEQKMMQESYKTYGVIPANDA